MKVHSASRAADALIEAFTGWKAEDVGFLVIMQTAWGPFDTWSDADRAWYSALMEDVGEESEAKTVYVLPDGEISREEAAAIAVEAILEGVEESVLELRAEYSGEIAPQVQAILESGDLTELMNCGRADLEVIAQSAYVYGLPDETAISQEAACEAAKAALTEAYGLPAGHFSKYESCYVYYDVTDTPLWRFVFNPKTLDVRLLEDGYDDPMLDRCFRAEVDAHTGEVVHVEEFAFRLSGYDLDYKLKWY